MSRGPDIFRRHRRKDGGAERHSTVGSSGMRAKPAPQPISVAEIIAHSPIRMNGAQLEVGLPSAIMRSWARAECIGRRLPIPRYQCRRRPSDWRLPGHPPARECTGRFGIRRTGRRGPAPSRLRPRPEDHGRYHRPTRPPGRHSASEWSLHPVARGHPLRCPSLEKTSAGWAPSESPRVPCVAKWT